MFFINKMYIHRRNLSKYVNRDKSAKFIRKTFLDYFINEKGHNFVRSSPVVPFCDPTVAFVNAGMNQFKSVFQGKEEPHYKKAANSQKCVRVGGKHNDLNIVGADGFHHTFFEMLGNWSFGDYFKSEACELSWRLLTDVYKISPERLYVTYFKGDQKLEIGEDLETKEIWKSLGVSQDRILPFGPQDNFWEMGISGPCGPCTEIHYDHLGEINRANFVNKGLFDLTEIWNIVFIQCNRNADGSLNNLPNKHVDTGMGFERLTSVLQGTKSNYDTDNFNYLFTALNKICRNVPKYEGKFGENDWNYLDTSYRILADHSRMITACLADGVIPEQNQKLRRVLRKSFQISETVFKKESGLVKELSNYVIENLGPVYPEMEKNIRQIQQIIDYEEDVYRNLRKTTSVEWEKIVQENKNLENLDVLESPGIIAAYKDLKNTQPKEITGEIAFKLYDTFGLDKNTILDLSLALKLPFNAQKLETELLKAKQRSKLQSIDQINAVFDTLNKQKVPKTNDQYKYNYSKNSENKYIFPPLDVKVLQIIQDQELKPSIGANIPCALLLDKTSLYSESGGQTCDQGQIKFNDNTFKITHVENLNNYILHHGHFISPTCDVLTTKTPGLLSVIDPKNRINRMRNHTATHLLNTSLKKIKGATCQKSSKVTSKYLNLDIAIFGTKLNPEQISQIDDEINEIIHKSVPVKITTVNSQNLLKLDDVTTVPGEIYPEVGIRLVEIENTSLLTSREPCCGTHVLNTGDLEHFCIISTKSLGKSTTSIHAVTGDRALLALKNGQAILEDINGLEKYAADNPENSINLDVAISELRQKLNYSPEEDEILPLVVKYEALEKIDSINKQIKDTAKELINNLIDMEMQNVRDSKTEETDKKQKFIVHYLRTSMILESVPLQRATQKCTDLPTIVISYTDNIVKARCCVPKDLVSENFNAQKWLGETVAKAFKSVPAISKGQDTSLVCSMKPKKINMQDWDTLLQIGESDARNFIKKHL